MELMNAGEIGWRLGDQALLNEVAFSEGNNTIARPMPRSLSG